MDQEQERIEADLRGLLEGEVRCDDVFVQMYASDASIFEINPLGVVRPRGTADVAACLRYAFEHHIPIHARGAGTGLAGESLGAGLVLDFSHSMRRIMDTQSDTVRVQPGVVHAQLNRHLASQGRLFGPDPATSHVTTMGSVLAVDGAGSHWLKYGSARDQVVSMQIVLADGEVLEVGREPLSVASDRAASSRRRELVGQLSELVGSRSKQIADHQPASLVNRSGYHLHNVLRDGHLHLAQLLVGSEGTLALITEATVRTQPLSAHRGVALMFFDRLEAAARAALEIPPTGASACDLMDRRLLSIARESDVRYDLLIPQAAEAMLLVEYEGDDEAEIRDSLASVVSRFQRRRRMAIDARTTMDLEEVNLFWQLARRVVPMLYRLKGSARPLPFVEDIAVPPEKLPDFLLRVQNVLKQLQVTASLFAHAGHGQLHIRPFLDLGDSTHLEKLYALASQIYEVVYDVGGTISGEHADGLSRSPFLRGQFGPLCDVFREVKRIFDPHNILNPGKVVAEQTNPLEQNLRQVSIAEPYSAPLDQADASLAKLPPSPAATAPQPVQLLLNWNMADMALEARSCNGCGHCRTQMPDTRMCPLFRNSPAEEASPRAKANLMRALLTGSLDPVHFTGDAMKSVADLCVNCHQCRLECPAEVDIPRLMVECKGQYVATNGLRPTDWFLTHMDKLSSLGSLVSPLANWAIGNRQMRWLLEKVLGIAQSRKLPRFAPRSFIRSAHRRRLTRPTRHTDRKVLYFVDVYANWHDVSLAEALLRVLQHNAIAVYVHPGQLQSGMAMITLGALERAKSVATHNISLLADAVRQGYHIITTEPSAALCLTHEYPNLIDDDDARLVADNTSEACSYLWKLHSTGKLELDLRPVPVTLGYHLPCHQKALDVGSPGENLLRLIPGMTVRRIDKGCSGMAGTYGLKSENYRSSLRAGWGLISAMRDRAIQVGTTECSACKIQMEQGTTKPTIHPIKWLALSYGLMPEVSQWMTRRGEELIVT